MAKIIIIPITLATFGMVSLFLSGCVSMDSVIKKHEVKEVPEIQFERIIKLYNPEGVPDKTLVGVVFVKKDARVCTDFAREITIKSLDELDPVEKQTYAQLSKYAIKPGEEIFGFVTIALDYRINIWENIKDEQCQYKVQIVVPEPAVRGNTGAGFGLGAGGHGWEFERLH